jgi:hypothetical protein
LPDWITLEEARTLAVRSGATDESLNEILMGSFRERRIGVTAVLEHAPVDRVREHWWARAAELEVMQMWRTPQHVEQFLTRAVRVCVAPDNRLRALVLWGNGAPPLDADTCILAAVHLHRPALAFELEAAGFTGESGTTSGDDQPPGRAYSKTRSRQGLDC